MAYATKYQIEFYDVYGTAWKILVQEDSWGGSITNLKATGNPLVFEFDGDDAFNDPVRPSKATFNVWSTSDFALMDFYSDEDFHFKVLIYYDTTLFWSGFINTSEYQEPYDCTPYPVQTKATDGLNYLKNILYDNAGVYYNGRLTIDQIITAILTKIQITEFIEYVNIYEESMTNGVGDSPFDQTLIDVDVFRDMNCYDVVSEILKPFNAVIRQVNGDIIIYRPTELVNAIVYGRTFPSKVGVSITPEQFINRMGTASDLKQFPGSVIMIKAAVKKISVNQDYGSKDSWIDNWELKNNTFHVISLGVWGCDYWTKNDNNTHFPLAVLIPTEKSGIVMGHNNYSGPLTKYSYQIFGDYVSATSDVFMFEIEYMIINLSGTARTDQDFYIDIKSTSNNFWLYGLSDGTGAWKTTVESIILTEDAPIGNTEWKRFSLYIPGIPADGSYTIKLFGSTDAHPTIYVAYRNIKFITTSDEIVSLRRPHKGPFGGLARKILKLPKYITTYIDNLETIQKEYLPICVPTSGKDLEVEYIIGDITEADSGVDNILDQFAGSLSRQTVQAAHVFNKCLIRNEEMNNSLSLTASTKLAITDKTGQVLTIDNLPDYDKFDLLGWVCMPCDEDKTSTSDPTPTGDYSYKEFCVIDRSAKTLTFAAGVDLTNFTVTDNVVLYNAFLNYHFVGDQTTNPIISVSGAPAWRSLMTGAGPMFRHSDGRFIMLFIGFATGPIGNIGYVSSTNMVDWTIGNSDAAVYAASSFPDCATVNLTGNCYPVDGSPGDYWCLVFYGQVSDGHGVHRIFYFDEDFTTFSYSGKLMTDADLGFAGGSVLKIGSTYHLIYMLITAAGVDYRSINAASSSTLEGPYTNYQTNIVRGVDANDGMAWSYATDAPCIFNDGLQVFGIFGAQAQWSQSGTKGNRQYCLLDWSGSAWSASQNGPVLVNPLYYQDLDGSYAWAGDHCGGYPSIFIEGADIYMSLTMKGSAYQVALIKMNNIGLEYPTTAWNTRGGAEDKPLLEIIGDELAEQHSRPKQLIQMKISDTIISGPVLDILGNFQDILNNIYGISVNLLTNPAGTSEDYDTFVVSGTAIISAINSSGSIDSRSNSFVITNGASYGVYFYFTLISGELPSMSLYKIGDNHKSNIEAAVEGLNIITLTATTSDTVVFLISNTLATNWSTTSIYLCPLPRKFVFNRGELSAKNRLWNTDLIEII